MHTYQRALAPALAALAISFVLAIVAALLWLVFHATGDQPLCDVMRGITLLAGVCATASLITLVVLLALIETHRAAEEAAANRELAAARSELE